MGSADFRTSTYDDWHTFRDFSADPSLSDVINVPAFTNLYQDQSGTAVYNYVYADHRISARRIVPGRQR